MEKLQIRKTLENKYVTNNCIRHLNVKARFRKVNIFITEYENHSYNDNAMDVLATRCIEEKILIEKSGMEHNVTSNNYSYLVPEHSIREFNSIYNNWKKELIQNRKNYLKLKYGKNSCACHDKHMCIYVNCGCSCHDEEKLLNPGVWKYAGTIRIKVIAYISAYGANSDYVKNLMDENFDSLDNSDIEYICQNACENSDNCVWCPLYKKICKNVDREERENILQKSKKENINILNKNRYIPEHKPVLRNQEKNKKINKVAVIRATEHLIIDYKFCSLQNILEYYQKGAEINNYKIPTITEIENILDEEIKERQAYKIKKIGKYYCFANNNIENKALHSLIAQIVESINDGWKNSDLFKETEILFDYMLNTIYTGRYSDIKDIIDKIAYTNPDFNLQDIETIVNSLDLFVKDDKDYNTLLFKEGLI